MCVWTVLFKGVDEAGEHEKDNADDDEDNSQLFPGLVKRVEEALKTREVSDHLEDAKDPQNPDLLKFVCKNMKRARIQTKRIMLPALLIICMLSRPV